MSVFTNSIGMSGDLVAVKNPGTVAPALSWQVRQWLRRDRWVGLLATTLARALSKNLNVITVTSSLRAVLIRADGTRIDHGIVSRRLVTTAFVEFMVDNLQADTTEWGDFKYHDSGTGTTGAAIGDTAIETDDGEARATGSQTEGATADIYKSVGTISYTTTKAITEHGLFSKSTGTTLMDRHVFAAINVDNGDSIQFTYELTVDDGG